MFASILVQVVFVPLYLKNFGQYQFGVLVVLLALVNFAVIGIAWMSGGSLRLLGEFAGLGNERDFRRAYGLIKTIYIGYGIFLAFLALIAALFLDHILFSGGTVEDIQAARISLSMTGIYLIFFFSVAVDRIALITRKRQGVANIGQLLGMVVFAAGVFVWLREGEAMPGVIGFYIVGAFVSAIFSRWMLNNELRALRMRLPSAADMDLLRRLGGKTGAGFFLHGAIILALLVDTAFIGWLGGAKVAAEFYLVWKIAEVLVQLIWKLPEPLAPYFVQMDVRGETAALSRIARLGYFAVGGVSLTVGIFYALFGHALVGLWVGNANAPNSPLDYALAGGAVFWMGISRLPIVLAGAQVALRELNWAGGMELFGKWGLAIVLFPLLGYTALLIGINVVHIFGVSFLYFRLLRHSLKVSRSIG